MDDLYDEYVIPPSNVTMREETCVNSRIRFGNFIGEAEESEDDSQHGIDASAYVYDQEYPEEEEVPEATGQELMEIDGSR
jgi:hypothetical protein